MCVSLQFMRIKHQSWQSIIRDQMKPKILDIDLNSPKERQQMDWEADIPGFHLAPLEKKKDFFQTVALDLVSDVNHLASSKLLGKNVLVQLHLSIISLSEVSVQTLNIIPVISVLSCIICIHTDETGEELCVHMNFIQPWRVDNQPRLPPALLRQPKVGCRRPDHRHT